MSGENEDLKGYVRKALYEAGANLSLISVPIPGGFSIRAKVDFISEMKKNLDLLKEQGSQKDLEEIQIYLDYLLEK
jgi:hypothetical protein